MEVDRLLQYREKDILVGSGSISNEEMEERVRAIYAEFDARRKAFDALEADKTDELMLSYEESDENFRSIEDVETMILDCN